MIFNQEYRQLTDEVKERVKAIKDKADELYTMINEITEPHLREAAISKTKLEECVMWAVKGITS